MSSRLGRRNTQGTRLRFQAVGFVACLPFKGVGGGSDSGGTKLTVAVWWNQLGYRGRVLADGDASMENDLLLVLMSCLLILHHLLHLAEFLLQGNKSDGGRHRRH